MSDFYDQDKIKDTTCNIVITRYGYGKTLYQLEKANKEIERLNNIISKAIEELENIPINANGGDILESERNVYHILKGSDKE